LELLNWLFINRLKNLRVLQPVNGNHLVWLKALLLTIMISPTLYVINQYKYGDNFIVTSMRLNPDRIDSKDERKLQPAD
jgi:hypothetical protein